MKLHPLRGKKVWLLNALGTSPVLKHTDHTDSAHSHAKHRDEQIIRVIEPANRVFVVETFEENESSLALGSSGIQLTRPPAALHEEVMERDSPEVRFRDSTLHLLLADESEGSLVPGSS